MEQLRTIAPMIIFLGLVFAIIYFFVLKRRRLTIRDKGSPEWGHPKVSYSSFSPVVRFSCSSVISSPSSIFVLLDSEWQCAITAGRYLKSERSEDLGRGAKHRSQIPACYMTEPKARQGHEVSAECQNQT